KNQNPQNGHHWARFDWGLGAVCSGASPVAAVFGSAPASATPPEHRSYFNPAPLNSSSKPDISTWQRTGHFYLALTRASFLNRRGLPATAVSWYSSLPEAHRSTRANRSKQ